ncbi:MAG: hypothetical protein AAGE03_00780 [Pseudomonadota bacterium]
MIRRLGLAGLVLVLAHPAAALSCLRPSVAQTFNTLNAVEETYIMVRGVFTALPREPAPPEGETTATEPYVIQARFVGDMATATGFDRSLDLPVTVEVGCTDDWCGSLPEGEMIAFLEQRSGFYVLAAEACPFAALPASPESEAQALSCLRAEACEAD